MRLQPHQTILFQGDSITDCGRSRDNTTDPNAGALGNGYPLYIHALLQSRFPEMDLHIINRGISGNRAIDLETRWQADCLALKPHWVSILIGINDTWRRYDRDDPTSARAFADSYRTILQQCTDAGIGIILLEPFVLPTPADRLMWREDLDPKIAEIRTLARTFGALYVPLDGLFAAQSNRTDPVHWAADGVHPTPAGHMLIAEAWMDLMT